MNYHRDRPKLSRTITYHFLSPVDIEGKTTDLLNKELESKETPVTQYGTDGTFLWMSGAPGAEMRRVLDEVVALGWVRKSNADIR
jgi:hypothetical protein